MKIPLTARQKKLRDKYTVAVPCRPDGKLAYAVLLQVQNQSFTVGLPLNKGEASWMRDMLGIALSRITP